MSDNKKKIDTLKRKLNENDHVLNTVFMELGAYLSNLNKAVFSATALAKDYKTVQSVKKGLAELEKKREGIKGLIQEKEKLAGKKNELGSAITKLFEEDEQEYEPIGTVAYLVYTEKGLEDKSYNELFLEVHRLDMEIKELDKEIVALSSGAAAKGVWDTLINTGRKAVLQTRRLVKTKAFPGFYRKIGRIVCESDFVSTVDDERLNQAMKGCFKRKKQVGSMEQQLKELLARQEEIDLALNEQSGGKGEAGIKELKLGLTELTAKLNAGYQKFGALYYQKPLETLEKDAESAAKISQIRSLEGEREKMKAEIKRLEITIQIELLEESSKVKQESFTALDAEIQKKRKVLRGLKKEINGLEEKIREWKEKLES